MRQIKFRAKSVHEDKWVYGFFVGDNDEPTIVGFDIWKDGEEDWSEEKIELHTVGQFTGLYDTYANEIYEGDIIQTNSGWKGIVKWNSNGYFFIKESENEDCISLGKMLSFATFRIIGNIHDNPKIMEGEGK